MWNRNWINSRSLFWSVIVLFIAVAGVCTPASAELYVDISDIAGELYDGISFPVNDTVVFTETGSMMQAWSWMITGPEAVPLRPNDQRVQYTFTVPGTYQVWVFGTNSEGGADSSLPLSFTIADDTADHNLFADFTYSLDTTGTAPVITLIDQSQVGENGDVIKDWYWTLDGNIFLHNAEPSEVVLPAAFVYGDHTIGLRIDTRMGRKAYIEKPVSTPGVTPSGFDESNVLITVTADNKGLADPLTSPYTVKYHAEASINGLSPKDSEFYIDGWDWFLGYDPVTWTYLSSNLQDPEITYTHGGEYAPVVYCQLKDGSYVRKNLTPGQYPWVHAFRWAAHPAGDPDWGSFTVGPELDPDFFWESFPEDPSPGHLVFFTDSSMTITNAIASRTWDFGDGNVTTVNTPPATDGSIWHRYKEPGLYWVSLTVTDVLGNQALESKAVVINKGFLPNPVNKPYGWMDADFGTVDGIVSGAAPLTVRFKDLSTCAPNSWLWNFGDGEFSAEQNPVHVFRNAGVYDVSLTMSNGITKNETVKPGYIRVT